MQSVKIIIAEDEVLVDTGARARLTFRIGFAVSVCSEVRVTKRLTNEKRY